MSQWQSQKLSRKTVSRGRKENKRCKLTAETTNVTCCLRIRRRGPDARLCLRAHDGLVRDSPRGNPAPEHNVKRAEKPRNHVCEYVFTVWRQRHLKSAFWSDVCFPLCWFRWKGAISDRGLEIVLTKLAKGNTLIGRNMWWRQNDHLLEVLLSLFLYKHEKRVREWKEIKIYFCCSFRLSTSNFKLSLELGWPKELNLKKKN